MKKLLLSIILISNLSFGQEATYTLNGISMSGYDDFFEGDNGIYYANIDLNNSYSCSISYLPKNGQAGWKKNVSLPSGFNPTAHTLIKPCNLSDHFIFACENNTAFEYLVCKLDYSGNVIWSRIVSYPNMVSQDYGSNSNPLTINAQDDVILFSTPYDGALLTKLDQNGNLIQSKQMSTTGIPNTKNPGFSVLLTDDGGYLITMKDESNPTVTKLDANFQEEWSKKWHIDSYSHPKLATSLPNGNYCIIGEGDHGTYMALVDGSGNLQAYKYNLNMNYPYKCKVVSNDSVSITDTNGSTAHINLSDNHVSIVTNFIYAVVKLQNSRFNILDFNTMRLSLDIENNEAGCLSSATSSPDLIDLQVSPDSITNTTMIIANLGDISNYAVSMTTNLNPVSLTPAICENNLSVAETAAATFTLYPNPSATGKQVTLAIEKGSGQTVQILSLSGKIMENVAADKSVFNAPQEAGMYFVQLIDQGGNVIAVEKLIVE